MNGFYIFFSLVLSINENVIKVYNNKDVELLCQDLVDVAPESGWYIGQSKIHYLVLKVVIADFQSCLQFMAFSDPHPMIGIR